MRYIKRFLTYSNPKIILNTPNPFTSRIFEHPEKGIRELSGGTIYKIVDLETWTKLIELKKSEYSSLAWLLRQKFKEVLRISGNLYVQPVHGSIAKIYHINLENPIYYIELLTNDPANQDDLYEIFDEFSETKHHVYYTIYRSAKYGENLTYSISELI